MKLESDLESNWWKIKFEEVHMHNKSVVRSLLSTSRVSGSFFAKPQPAKSGLTYSGRHLISDFISMVWVSSETISPL